MKKLLGLLLFLLPLISAADTVVPVESVESYVNIRSAPEAGAEVVGRLQKGIPLEHVDSVPGWHEVAVSDGLTGFVSADWSEVVPAEPVAAEAPEPELAAQEDAESTGEAPAPVDESPSVDAIEATEAPEPPPEPAQDAVAAMPEPAPEPAAEPEPVAEAEPAAEPEPIAEAEPVEEPVAADVEPAPEPAPPERPTPAEAAPEPVVITGPPGPRGPAGPPGAANIDGDVGYLVRFRTPTMGESSQIYDDGNRIGIGTTEPAQRLEVNGNIQINEQNSSVAGLMITQAGGETGYIMHNRASTLTIGSGSVDRVTIDRDGNVGIGVARPSQPLELANGAHVSAGGVWTNSSSRQNKENIAGLSAKDALDALTQLQPVRYNYRNDAGESYVGFIAEDVPELVATSDRQGLSPMDIVAVLTRVIQAQQQRIEQLESRLDALN